MSDGDEPGVVKVDECPRCGAAAMAFRTMLHGLPLSPPPNDDTRTAWCTKCRIYYCEAIAR